MMRTHTPHHELRTHRWRQRQLMGYSRPTHGLLAQILYDMEAFHRDDPTLFRRQSSA